MKSFKKGKIREEKGEGASLEALLHEPLNPTRRSQQGRKAMT